MEKQAVWPSVGPETKGPYSPAIVFDKYVFVSGQGPVDPKTGEFLRGSAVDEFKVAVSNVKLILEEAGSSLEKALKVTLYLADMDDFQAVNAAYKDIFGPTYPARTTLQAGRLPFDIKVEVDVIAYRDV